MTTLEQIQQRAESDAKTHGYYLNPDPILLRDLLEGLKKNEERYGYPSCPCRLASGKFDFDRDITCPCDYRDPDVEEYGACYCALYIRKEMHASKAPILPIPERRPLEKQTKAYAASAAIPAENPSEMDATIAEKPSKDQRKMWYCKQCGYICFREEPPLICPICRAKRKMFGVMMHARRPQS